MFVGRNPKKKDNIPPKNACMTSEKRGKRTLFPCKGGLLRLQVATERAHSKAANIHCWTTMHNIHS